MLSKLEFATALVYCPRGISEKAKLSKTVCGHLKNGNVKVTSQVCDLMLNHNYPQLTNFINGNVAIVPMPRSAPLSIGALWPSKIIADELVNKGLGGAVFPILNRTTAVPKSSLQTSAKARPTCKIHFDSFTVTPTIIPYDTIVLVDDVLTLGRTSMAAAQKIKDAYPDYNVKVFTIMRTRGFEDNNILLKPENGTMYYNNSNGKVQLPD